MSLPGRQMCWSYLSSLPLAKPGRPNVPVPFLPSTSLHKKMGTLQPSSSVGSLHCEQKKFSCGSQKSGRRCASMDRCPRRNPSSGSSSLMTLSMLERPLGNCHQGALEAFSGLFVLPASRINKYLGCKLPAHSAPRCDNGELTGIPTLRGLRKYG